jgi:signal transduction histidine kinase
MQWAEQLVILGEMAGGLAHEIKNPLAGIKASTEVLSRDRSVSAENRAVLRMVSEQIRRIEVILKGLLNFAKPPKPQFTLVQLNSVLEATVGLVKQHPAFSARDGSPIELLTDLDARVPPITADPHQLQQVVMNLLINSAEAMPEGGTIALYTTAPEGEPFVRIKVSDTGPGIEAETAGRIFQPFFTTKSQGTGLGLAITKGLIEQHGGNIRVENNRDRGASFTLELPIRQNAEAEGI